MAAFLCPRDFLWNPIDSRLWDRIDSLPCHPSRGGEGQGDGDLLLRRTLQVLDLARPGPVLRHGGVAVVTLRVEYELVPVPRKDGTPGKRLATVRRESHCTHIGFCDLCPRVGPARVVCLRHDCASIDTSFGGIPFNATPALCTACWNRLRAINKRIDQANNLRGVLRNIQKEIRNVQDHH